MRLKDKTQNIKTPNHARAQDLDNKDGSLGPVKLIRKILEFNRRDSLDVIPAAGDIVLAYIVHVEKINIANSGLSMKSTDFDPAIGFFGKKSSNSKKNQWYKAYGFVDFYSSCLPYPEKTMSDPDIQKKILNKKITDINRLLDKHSLMRISRFPYFLAPEAAVISWAGGRPTEGCIAQVQFLDKDNYSYGLFRGIAEESALVSPSPKKTKNAQAAPLGAHPNARNNLEGRPSS